LHDKIISQTLKKTIFQPTLSRIMKNFFIARLMLAAGCLSTLFAEAQTTVTSTDTSVCAGTPITIDINITPAAGQYPAGTVFCASGPTAIVDVTNPTTGKTWMDRNLGASQAATSSTDAASYGDLYQWGRAADGHQCRNSATTSSLSSTDQPGHGDFIVAPNTPFDWRSPQNINLWQGTNGVNNPCPNGYRLPTETELDTERLSWGTNDAIGAFGSPLKLPAAGGKSYNSGAISGAGTDFYYWSSTVNTSRARALSKWSTNSIAITSNGRSIGSSVRCVKN
jgi:hypothetical protein